MSAISLSVVMLVYGLLYLTTGFNEAATFIAAIRNQAQLNAAFYFTRPYPQTIPSDVQDFLLASGWISLPLATFYLLRKPINPIVLIAAWLRSRSSPAAVCFAVKRPESGSSCSR